MNCVQIHELHVEPSKLTAATCVGILEKKGKHGASGWHRRLVVIQHNMMYMYKSPKELPSGIWCLDGCHVDKSTQENNLSFQITTVADQSIFLRATNPASQDNWIAAIDHSSRCGRALRESRDLLRVAVGITTQYRDVLRKKNDPTLLQQKVADAFGDKEMLDSASVVALLGDILRDTSSTSKLSSLTDQLSTRINDNMFCGRPTCEVPSDAESWNSMNAKFLAEKNQAVRTRRTLPIIKKFLCDDAALLSALFASIDCQKKMQILEPLLRIFGQQHKLDFLLKWAIEQEFQSGKSTSLLFRSDGAPGRLLSVYTREVGSAYLHGILCPHIQHLCSLSITDLELNPTKDKTLEVEEKARRNAANLMKLCQGILDTLLGSINSLPGSFLCIFKYMADGASASRFSVYENAKPSAIVLGNFFFLRFVCPAITSPDKHGIINGSLSISTRRILLLVTKVLVNAATGKTFGEKEPYMIYMNRLINENSARVTQFFARLSSIEPEESVIEAYFQDDSNGIFVTDNCDEVEQIHSYLAEHRDQLLSSNPKVERLLYS